MNGQEIKEIILQKSPNYTHYPTYEELVDRIYSKGKNKVRIFGKSTEGRAILGYEIGEGEKKVLIYGQPHADELVGILTVDYLFAILEEEEIFKGIKFLLIPSVDPDGLKRNELLIKEPFDQKTFFLNKYQRPESVDIDWSFPIKVKGYNFKPKLKETKTLVKIMNKHNLRLLATLHCIQFAGVHVYADRNYPEYFDEIEAFVSETPIPMQKGIPFFLEQDEQLYRPGFYKIYSTADALRERWGNEKIKPTRGEFSAVYYKTLYPEGTAIVPEVPLYYDGILGNEEPSAKTRKEVSIERCDIMLEIIQELQPIWQSWRKKMNKKHYQFPILREIMEYWPAELMEEKETLELRGSIENATKSEEYSNTTVVRYNNCNIIGIMYQLVSESRKIPTEVKEEIMATLVRKIDHIEREVNSAAKIQLSDLNELVKIQTFIVLQAVKMIADS